jgi:hypothetical protein
VDNTQQKATSAFIRKCGYHQHFPRSGVYGTYKFGGLGFLQLEVKSNCNKIQSLICHVNNNTMLDKRFKINLNWLQVLAGTSQPI